jgi:hypothetical protein
LLLERYYDLLLSVGLTATGGFDAAPSCYVLRFLGDYVFFSFFFTDFFAELGTH